MPTITTTTRNPRERERKPKGGRKCGCAGAQTCGACGGLETLERPRFFAGQLLTEAELNAAQEYVRSKSRLQNLRLHGPGVVCGLQVTCHECKGWVTVQEGYAIDPCGEDIVVATEHEVNVIDEIRKCRAAERKARDCDPVRTRDRPDCKEEIEHWCVAISYDEVEARPTTALTSSPSGSCSCGGNGNGHSHGNGNGNGKSQCGCGGTATRPTSELGVCEPTRIHESYRIHLYESDEDECRSLSDMLEETALARIIECVGDVFKHLSKRVPASSRKRIVKLSTDVPTTLSEHSAEDLYDDVDRYYWAVRDIYDDDPIGVRCAPVRTRRQREWNPPKSIGEHRPDSAESTGHPLQPSLGDREERTADSQAAYAEYLADNTWSSTTLLMEYLIDCVCLNLMPPCSPPAEDDRLVLACLRVRGDEVIDICNFDCRRHAGAFPSLYHWLSVVPVLTLARYAIGFLCCADVERLVLLLTNVARSQTTQKSRQGIVKNDFAAVKGYRSMAENELSSVMRRVRSIADFSGPTTGELVATPPDEALKLVDDAGGQARVVEVESADAVPEGMKRSYKPFVGEGDRVVLLKHGDEVVGVAHEPKEDRVAVLEAELERLKTRVEGKPTRTSKTQRKDK